MKKYYVNSYTYHEFFETMTNTRVMCRWYVGLNTNIFEEIWKQDRSLGESTYKVLNFMYILTVKYMHGN